MHLYPRAPHTWAMPIPVFPAVPSITVPPGLSSPRSSASLMMAQAALSFTDPPGFINSALATMSQPVSLLRDFSRMSGVFPRTPMKPSLAVDCEGTKGAFGVSSQSIRLGKLHTTSTEAFEALL